MLGLAIGPTILGHALVNYSLRHIRGQRVAVTTQCQFVFAALFELALHGRLPPWGFYIAAPLVLAGAWIVMTGTGKRAPRHSP